MLKEGGPFPALPLVSSGNTQLSDRIFTVGFPRVDIQETTVKYTDGSISSLSGIADSPRYFQISAPVQPGNSGGPLINSNGQVIGMIIARLSDLPSLIDSGLLPQNVNYALKSAFLLPFVESVPGLSSQLKTGTLSGNQAIDNASKAVVMVLAY